MLDTSLRPEKQGITVQPTFTREHSTAFKGLAIIFVLIHHGFGGIYQVPGPLNPVLGINLKHHILLIAKFGVAIFTFINGYGMALSFASSEKKNPANSLGQALSKSYVYSARSAMKLLYLLIPSYFLSLSLTLLFKGDFFGIYPNPLNEILLDFFGLALVLRSPSINSPWWYVVATMIYHLFFPILYYATKRFPKLMVFFTILASLSLAILSNEMLAPLLRYISYLYYFTVYLLGIMCAHINAINRFFIPRLDLSKHQQAIQLSIITLLWFVIFIVRQTLLFGRGNYYTLDGFLTILSIYGFVYLVRLNLAHDALRFMGTYSTELFLTHALALRLRNKVVFADSNALLMSLRLIGVSLFIVWIMLILMKLTRYTTLMKKMTNEKIAPIIFAAYFLFSIIATIVYVYSKV